MTGVGEADSKTFVHGCYIDLKDERIKDNCYFNPGAIGVMRTPAKSMQRQRVQGKIRRRKKGILAQYC